MTSFFYAGAYAASNPLFLTRLEPTTWKYRFVLPLNKAVAIPIITPDQSKGPFVRALIETEEAGTKLLAYDSYLRMGEVVEVWSRATGKVAELVVVSAGFMNREFVDCMGGPRRPGIYRRARLHGRQ